MQKVHLIISAQMIIRCMRCIRSITQYKEGDSIHTMKKFEKEKIHVQWYMYMLSILHSQCCDQHGTRSFVSMLTY